MRRNVFIIAGGIAAGVMFAGTSVALETTANENIKNVTAGFETRLASSIAAIGAVDKSQDEKIADIYEKLKDILERLDALEKRGTGETPAGTIAAFNLAACPTGWTRYTAADGRFLVGAGTAGGRTYSAIGGTTDTASGAGAAMLTLAQANLPAVSLDVYFSKWVKSDDAAGSGQVLMANRQLASSSANGGLGITAQSKTARMGSGTAFDNRPPFSIVMWCRKN